MSRPFDAALKDLGAESPEAFVTEFDGPPRLPVTALNGPLGMLPLAVLAKLPSRVPLEQGLARVIQQLCDRLKQEARPEKFDRCRSGGDGERY